MKRRIAIVAACLVALSGCDDQPRNGRVVRKRFDPARTTYRTAYVPGNGGQSGGVAMVPVPQADAYMVTLRRNGESLGSIDENEIIVDKETYYSCKLGEIVDLEDR